jgi:Spy/CpxP family protein refolding chaperone
MKKKATLAVLLGCILAMPILAQGDRRPMSFTERYGSQLTLTDTQKKTIDDMENTWNEDHAKFITDYRQTMADYRAAREANDTAKVEALKPKFDAQRGEMMKLRGEQEDKIAGTFTDSQKATWSKIKEERAARMKEREQHQH